MHTPEQTIVALSTPPGRGGIAVVRLSGPGALDCAREVFIMSGNGRIEAGRSILGTLRSLREETSFDTGFLTLHPAGRSYTGEEVVELSCHGSPAVVEHLLEELMAAGAEPAEPGEFTYRAVLNGRLDLAQAEGVRDLIEASTRLAARVAHEQVRGALSREVISLREELVEIICRAEATLEFAEEVDPFTNGDGMSGRIRNLEAAVGRFVTGYRRGRLLRDGARVVLAGRPNAGKSSLFNRLLRCERAIVSPVPGTTRDFLSERIDLDGIPVTLIDTAGLRPGAEGLEGEGIDRSRRRIEAADLVLLLCACDDAPDAEDLRLLQEFAGRVVPVASKADLGEPRWAAAAPFDSAPRVSAVTSLGLDDLRAAIFKSLASAPSLSHQDVLISDARHHEALLACSTRLARAREAIESGATEEITLNELHAALRHLGEITGAVSLDDLYDRIFSTFCIGK